MPTINGKVCVVNGVPVDKVFSNGKQVYGRNLWSDKKAVSYYISAADGLPHNSSAPDAAMIDPVIVPSTATKLVVTIYNPNKVVNTVNTAKPSFFKGDNYLGRSSYFQLTGDTVQKKEWTIPSGTTKTYLATLLGAEKAENFDFSIKTKYEFDTATPWTPAPEDVLKGYIAAPKNLKATAIDLSTEKLDWE